MGDIVFLRNIHVIANIGLDCWHRDKPQPAQVSLQFSTNIQLAGETDDVVNTIHYGNAYKAVDKHIAELCFPTLDAFTEEVARVGLDFGGGKTVRATTKLPKVIMLAEGNDGGVAVEVEMEAGESGTATVQSKVLRIQNLRVACILGVNDHERTAKQLVALNLDLFDGKVPDKSDYQAQFAPLIKHVEESNYLTLEALCLSITKILVKDLGFGKARVSVEKPNAYGVVDCPGVIMTRTARDFDK